MDKLISILKENNKNVIAEIDNKKFYIEYFYIVDEQFYFIITNEKEEHIGDNLLYYIELESQDECWNDSPYVSAMDRIGNCDFKLLTNEQDFEYECKIVLDKENIILKACSDKKDFLY